MESVDMIQPALAGVYAVGGIYINRSFRQIQSPVSLEQVGYAAGATALSSALAPLAVPYLVCPVSDAAPYVEAAISTAIAWELVMLGSDMNTANMYAPIHLGSVLLANYVSKMLAENQGDSATKGDKKSSISSFFDLFSESSEKEGGSA